jgi:hypothetical protein
MRVRVGLLALTLCALLIAVPAASAQEPAAMTKVLSVAGQTKGGKTFTGTYSIDRFRTSRGQLVSTGTLRGRLGRRRVVERDVRMPAALSSDVQGAQVLPPIPGACEILNLVLGPINLDLLGLVVRTNRINVRIDAVPGEGNLLGNLLCAITGILDPQTAAARDQAAALNAILALVPRTG